MSHFAEISGSGSGSITYTVTRVIVAEQDFIDSGAVGNPSKWIQTSRNTYGGVHYGQDGQPDGGTQLRKNYAGLGHTYDESKDAFITPQPQSFDSSSISGSAASTGSLYVRNYFIQNPTGSIPYILNEDSCLWELSGSS